MQDKRKNQKVKPKVQSNQKSAVKKELPHKNDFPRKQTVYVGNLNYKMTADNVKFLFFDFGYVISAMLVKKNKTQNSGMAFVEMRNKMEAEKAIKALNGKVICGRTIKVGLAVDKLGISGLNAEKKFSKKEVENMDAVHFKAKAQIKPKKRTGLDQLFQNTRK